NAYRVYVIKKQVREATSTNGDPKDQLSPKHDLEGPSVVVGRRSCPRDQGVALGQSLTTRQTNISLVLAAFG
ncbi:hypothetical protein U9M48_031993, partial [Paspalum notatum var. saurae]